MGKNELVAIKAAHDVLRAKLRPQLTEFGFLDAGLSPPQAEHCEAEMDSGLQG